MSTKLPAVASLPNVVAVYVGVDYGKTDYCVIATKDARGVITIVDEGIRPGQGHKPPVVLSLKPEPLR